MKNKVSRVYRVLVCVPPQMRELERSSEKLSDLTLLINNRREKGLTLALQSYWWGSGATGLAPNVEADYQIVNVAIDGGSKFGGLTYGDARKITATINKTKYIAKVRRYSAKK